jgi:DDE superfamily endonuclease
MLELKKILPNDNAVMMPYKKPRGKELTKEQKQENKAISGIRIVVDHAINGIKRFGSMSNTYRNKKG